MHSERSRVRDHQNIVLFLSFEGHEVTVKVLIDAGSDIEVKNSHEETALDCAVREGRLGAVKVLLDHGALIENKEDVSHSTALHVAAKNGYDAIVRLLLLRGATIDRRDEDSLTALDLAVMGGYRGVAQALVEADDWQKIMTPKDELPLGRHNEARRTPMRDLISEFPDVAKIVLSKCVEEQGEKSAAYYRVAYDFSLIDDTYMMPSKDGTVLVGERCPYHAGKLKKEAKTYSEDYDVVYENHPLKLMVRTFKNHSTALHVAAKNGYDAIVRLLLLRGATIDRRDEDSLTALDLAVMGGYRGVAQALVEADDWQKIMTPKDELPLGRHNEARRTPMRDLISEFPDVAKIVLSKCVEEQGEKSAAYYRVAYDFSLIDDTYMMPSKDGTVLVGERCPYHAGKLKKEAKTYSEDYDVVYENHPLKLMVRTFKKYMNKCHNYSPILVNIPWHS
ncbi:hypothetical protein Y032_0973g3259 [Ancylostoma ceylanicum]|uniref:Ankyrin repeat protein n=1 Tax=Ancylostoma ceylanicum TaxID=53326 RepID=A0A016W7I8_9BILA|nr:hypothetical protein Y032_0973g3259 [Ancylostoma ceylanicum]